MTIIIILLEMSKLTKKRNLKYPFLKEPIPITEQSWSDDVQPLLSISSATYMHESFIRDTIEGFLMQQTNFKIEILIHDDASTDQTAAIIQEYEIKYPGLIKPTYQIENQFSKKQKTSNYIKPPRRIGQYIAFCEGDDYWTNPLKLQKQVDFLEANEDFAICHHNMKTIYEQNIKESHLSNSPNQKEITTIEDLAQGNYIYTASCVCRNGLFGEYPDWISRCPVGDYPTHMLNAQFGKIKYIPEVMGVYRVHKGGLWENKDEIYRTAKWVDLIDQMKFHFAPNVNKILIGTQNRDAKRLMIHYKDQPDKCKYFSDKLLENNPLYILNLTQDNVTLKENLALLNEEVNQKNKLISQNNSELDKLEKHINQKEEEKVVLKRQLKTVNENLIRYIKELNQRNWEISAIVNSRTYKLLKILRVLVNFYRPWVIIKMIRNKIRFEKTTKLIQQSKLFNKGYYLQNNPDVNASKIHPLKHYLLFGGFEGRNPSENFDSAFYLEQNPDVKVSGVNPLVHYLRFGKVEGRNVLP